jgi:hypothetical protein
VCLRGKLASIGMRRVIYYCSVVFAHAASTFACRLITALARAGASEAARR